MTAAPRPQLGRPFGVHLSTVGLANLADGIVQTGLPLVALTLTRSPVLMGVLVAAVWLPWLLLGLPAGVLVDRWDRRRTILVALGLRAAMLSVLVGVALTSGLTIWWLIAFALLYGATEVFADLAAMAQVPTLVSREPARLRSATSRLLAVQHLLNGFVGPPVAGVLIALGAAWVVGVPAIVVALGVLCLAIGLRGRFAAVRPEGVAVADLRTELWEGLRISWRHPVLRPLLIGSGLWNFASTGFSAVILLWMVGPGSRGGLTPQEWALIAVALPVGALLGSWLSGRVLARWREMRVLVWCWGLNGALNLLPLLVPTAWGFAAFLLAVGALGVTGNVVSGSIRPRMVPEHVLGTVGGAARVLGYGAMPLGALVGGQVAAWAGIPVVLVGVVVVMLAATELVRRQCPQAVVDAHELALPAPAAPVAPPTRPEVSGARADS